MNSVINDCLINLNTIGRTFWQYSAAMFIQSSVLIILLLIIDFMLRKRIRAVFRYCVWLLVFLKLVLPPTLCMPTGVGYWFGDLLSAKQTISEPILSMPVTEPATEPVTHQVTGIDTEIPQAQSSRSLTEEPAPVETTVSTLPAITWQTVVFLTWLAGILVFSVLLIQRVFFVRGLIAQSASAQSRLFDMLDRCRRQLGISRDVELRLSGNIQSPAVCGLVRPVILMPKALLHKLSQGKLRAVLIHELAHIKRGDLWVNLAQTVLQVIYFYNPFVWLTNAIVRRIREQAVDEMVLVALGAEAKSYSNTLIDIAETTFFRANLALSLIGVAESKKSLERRIKHILTRPIPKNAKIGVIGVLALIIAGAVLIPMAKAEKNTYDSNGWVTKWKGKDTKTIGIFDGPDGSIGVGRISEENGVVEVDIYDTYYEDHECRIIAISKWGKIYTGKLRSRIESDKGARFNKARFEDISLKKIREFRLQIRPVVNNNFTATLPNGVTVELVGLGKNPWESEQEWWRPDGVEIEKPEFKTIGPPHKWPTDPNRLQFQCAALCKFSNYAGKSLSVPEVRFSNRELLSAGLVSAIADDGAQVTYIVYNPDMGVVPDKADISLAVGTAPFKKARTPSRKFNEKAHETYYLEDNSVVIRHPLRIDHYIGTLTLDLTCPPEKGVEYRVVAELKNGQTEQWHGGSVGKEVRFFHATPRRENIKVEDIKQLIIEYRPYDWITFRNVSLQPGVKTDVQVEAETIEQQKPQIRMTELVGYWSFDGNANDRNGRYNGIVHGATLTEGVSGQAYYFDDDDYITIEGLSLAAFSFSAWVKTETKYVNNRRIFLLDGSKNFYSLQGNSRGAIGLYITDDIEINEYDWSFEVGKWTHITVTYNGHNVNIYKNGRLTETEEATFTQSMNGDIYIGGIESHRRGGFWHGVIDEVAIFDGAISAQEVDHIYNMIRPSVRLVVGEDKMTFEGQEVTWEQLPALLEKVPNRGNTVFELAVSTKDMSLSRYDSARSKAGKLVEQFGFEYLSYVGQHPLGSKAVQKPDVQVGKGKDSDRQRVSQWIGADLPNSASNINFHETHFIDTSRMYVKFDFPVSDLKALLSESHQLPTFAQLTKDKKIMERVLEPDLDWWKLDELKDPSCGELRRGHYAPETLKPESMAVWIHSESQICCSEIEKGLMRVYIASLTDSSVVRDPALGEQTEIANHEALKKVLYGMMKLVDKPAVALDLDNGEVIQLDKDWPDEYEVAWDNDGGGVLMSKPNGPAKLWPISDIKNFYDTCDKVSKGNIKIENGNGHGVFANQSKFALVKTSQTNTAVVEIVDFDETEATIRWQIICQKSNDK